MSVWMIKRDRGYKTNVDLWLGGGSSIPAIKCDVCGETWMIPTTNSLISVTEEVKSVLGKLKRPMAWGDLARVRSLFGENRGDLFPGARVGAAAVRKLRGRIVGEFAWFEGSAVLCEEDFERLRGMVGDGLEGCHVVTRKGQQPLVELAWVPLNLRRLYPKTRCEACDRRDTTEVNQDELGAIYRLAESSASLHPIPGGIVCGDAVRSAIEALGFRNCTFTEWSSQS